MISALLMVCSLSACADSDQGPVDAGAASFYAGGEPLAQEALAEEKAAGGTKGAPTRGTAETSSSVDATSPGIEAPAAPAPAQPDALDAIIGDMRGVNDFTLRGYESFKNGWYVGPGETHMGNNPSFSNSPTWSFYYNNPSYAGVVAKAILPWLAIFDGPGHAASNTAVEMGNMRTYMKSRSTGKWVLLGGPANVTGTYYGKPSTNLPALSEMVASRAATTSVIKIHPNPGYHWHGWWNNGRVAFNPNDMGAVFVTMQARQVVADSSKPDDRYKAQLGVQVGADYYIDTATVYRDSYAPAIGISRTKQLTNEWQSFSYTTLSDVGKQMPGGGITEAQFRAAPPPLQ